MKLARFVGSAFGIALLTFAMGSRAQAQVNDQAGFFSADAIKKAEQTIAGIQRRGGRKVVVETFQTLPPELKSSYSNARKNQFYQSWIEERGKATGSDIHILAVREPAHLEVGANTATRQRAFTPSDHQATSRAMLERFRAKRFDDGLLEGLAMIAATLEERGANSPNADRGANAGNTGANPNTPVSPSAPAPRETPRAIPTGGICGGGGIGGWLCLIIGALAIVTIVRRIAGARRSVGYGGRPNYDPRTGQPYYPPGGGGGGGGFGSGMLGGLLGGILGGAAYDHFLGGHGNQASAATPPPDPTPFGGGGGGGGDVSSGGDFGSSDFSSGGDFGGGGGGGDFGGGGGDVSSGGDF